MKIGWVLSKEKRREIFCGLTALIKGGKFLKNLVLRRWESITR